MLAGAVFKMMEGFGDNLPRMVANNDNLMRQLARRDLGTSTPPRPTMPPAVPVPLATEPVRTPQEFAEAYLREMAATGDEPSRSGMWKHAVRRLGYQRRHDTRAELLAHFPPGAPATGGRPRKPRKTSP
jgi:hypothetical protein